MVISLVVNSRAEQGPMSSVIAALPEAVVTRFDATGLHPAIAMSKAMTFFTAMFTAQNAMRVVVLGDRYETLAAALAAMFLRIPVAHIHGGETTTGAFDDPMRHAITHIADIHFVATDNARKKVAKLEPWADSIHLVGAPGLDGIAPFSATRSEETILCTYHPETRATDYGLQACANMLEALAVYPDYQVLFTPPNADPGSAEIVVMIDKEIQNHANWNWVALDHAAYIEAMQSASLVIGNSSAGVIEAPWVGAPSVNIGLRQYGREMANTVFQVAGDRAQEIAATILSAIYFKGIPKPVYRGGAAPKIAAIIRESLQCPLNIAI